MASLRSLATVSGFTAISRVLGFLRDILIARFVGTGLVGDAFFAAFRFPNMFRRIFGEGAFNAAFVPLFGKKLEQDGKDAAIGFANNAFSTLVAVLGILTFIAIPCMPWIMGVVVPGFKAKFRADLAAAGESGAAYAVEINTRGARDVYFQVRSPGEAGAGGWVRRIRIADPVLVQKEERSIGDLLGSGLQEGEAVSIAGGGFELEGLKVEDGALVLDGGDGRGRILLPGKHAFVAFAGRVEIEPGAGASLDGRAWFEIFRNHPDTFGMAVSMSRITFSYLLCMALAALLSGVLNTFKIFGMPAAAPIILNLVFLAGLGMVWWRGWIPGPVLAWSVAIAGVLQLGALWVTSWLRGARIRLMRPRFNAEMRRLFTLMGPGVASASVQQVNLLVGGIVASFQQGAVSYLYYSERVYQLPLGMIGIAMGVVLLPEVTRQLRSGRESAAVQSIVKGVELAVLITAPAAVALMLIPGPVISVLFEHGKFDAESSRQTARALAGFAAGLPAYVLIKVLQPGYFAREDTKSPMVMAAITVAVNIGFSLALFPFLRHVGIALATSIAGWVNVMLLATGLRRSGFISLPRASAARLWKMLAASAVMGAVVWGLHQGMHAWFEGARWMRAGALGLVIAAGLAVYGAAVLALRAADLRELRSGLRSS